MIPFTSISWSTVKFFLQFFMEKINQGELQNISGPAFRHAISAKINRIVFIPLDEFPPELLEEIADEYRLMLGLKITIHEPISVDRIAMDYKRGQYIGEEVIKSVILQLTELSEDPTVLLIAFTSTDIYIGWKRNWRFAFALRVLGRFAVVSTARMDPEAFGAEEDDALLMDRIRKMVSKTIGGFYYGLPERTDKSSVMFSPILGVNDLDEVSPEYDELDLERIVESGKYKES